MWTKKNDLNPVSTQYVGNPIDCIHSKDIPEEVLNTFCWIHSTYTIPSAFWKRIGFDVAHPGVDKTLDPEERRYHKYYQWVCFCLFFQVSNFVHQGCDSPIFRQLFLLGTLHSQTIFEETFVAVELGMTAWSEVGKILDQRALAEKLPSAW